METDETNQAPDGGEDPRLTSLEDRLRNAQTAEDKRTEPLKVRNIFTGKGSSQGNRVLSAIVGAPLGGLFVGFALDQVLGTRPWVMLGMMFFGIVAGLVQVWRISQENAE